MGEVDASPKVSVLRRLVVVVCAVSILATAIVATEPFETAPTASAAGSSFVGLTPGRLFETRRGASTVDGQQSGLGRRAAGQVSEVQVAGRAGVPADAVGVVVNVTSIGADQEGFVTVFPCGAARPEASTLNHARGEVVANGVTLKLGVGGRVCVYTQWAMDLVVDVGGYFPATVPSSPPVPPGPVPPPPTSPPEAPPASSSALSLQIGATSILGARTIRGTVGDTDVVLTISAEASFGGRSVRGTIGQSDVSLTIGAEASFGGRSVRGTIGQSDVALTVGAEASFGGRSITGVMGPSLVVLLAGRESTVGDRTVSGLAPRDAGAVVAVLAWL